MTGAAELTRVLGRVTVRIEPYIGRDGHGIYAHRLVNLAGEPLELGFFTTIEAATRWVTARGWQVEG